MKEDIHIKKRDGSRVPLDIQKIHKVVRHQLKIKTIKCLEQLKDI